jgi:hypothetical protein
MTLQILSRCHCRNNRHCCVPLIALAKGRQVEAKPARERVWQSWQAYQTIYESKPTVQRIARVGGPFDAAA